MINIMNTRELKPVIHITYVVEWLCCRMVLFQILRKYFYIITQVSELRVLLILKGI